MEQRNKLLIIIPAYNEEKNIGKVLSQLTEPELASIADILVMNDASKDNTKEVAESYGAKVITHVYNLGYGCGLQLGFKYAVEHGYEYVIQMDADGQHDVCNVKTIYDELQKTDENGNYPDIVLGSRFVKGSVKYPTSLAKKFAYKLFGGLIRLGTKKKIYDPTTGLQGLNRRTFEYYSKYNHFENKYPDANILMQMLMLGCNVREIPALMHVRTEGKSMHSGLKPIIYMLRMTFSIIAVWLRIKVFRVDVGEL